MYSLTIDKTCNFHRGSFTAPVRVTGLQLQQEGMLKTI